MKRPNGGCLSDLFAVLLVAVVAIIVIWQGYYWIEGLLK